MSAKSRMARVLGRTLRAPGMGRMFQAMVGLPVLVLVHRGRKSGRLYKTPLSILAEAPEGGEVFVSPMWSRES